MEILNNSLINIILSLTLIYAMLSMLVSSMLEWWNTINKERGKHLSKAINQMLNDPLNHDYGTLFFEHFMIGGLNYDAKHPAPYISSNLFSDTLIDILASQVLHSQEVKLIRTDPEKGKIYEAGDPLPADLKGRLELSLKLMKSSPFKDVMESFWLKANSDVSQFKKNLEDWYDDHMERVSGWYKYDMRTKSLVFGFIVAISLNIDSLHLLKVLSLDTNLRNMLVATADNVAKGYSDTIKTQNANISNQLALFNKAVPDSLMTKIHTQPENIVKYFSGKKDSIHYKQVVSFINSSSTTKKYLDRADSVLGITASLNIPIGWSHNVAPISWFVLNKPCVEIDGHSLSGYSVHRNTCFSFGTVFIYLIGIGISGVSLSLGAPFWFDMLLKVVNVRRVGKRPETAKLSKA